MYNEQYTLVTQQVQVCMTLTNIIGEEVTEKKNTIILKRSEDFLIFLCI